MTPRTPESADCTLGHDDVIYEYPDRDYISSASTIFLQYGRQSVFNLTCDTVQLLGRHEHKSSPRAVSPSPLTVHEPSKATSPGQTPALGSSEPLSGGQKLSRGNSKGLERGGKWSFQRNPNNLSIKLTHDATDQPAPTSKSPSKVNDATHGQQGTKRKISELTSSQRPTQPSSPTLASTSYPGCRSPQRQKRLRRYSCIW